MSIKFQCPNCQQQLGVKSEHAGKKLKCPNCQAICQVPENSQQEDLFGGSGDDLYGGNDFSGGYKSAPAGGKSNPYSAPSSFATHQPKMPQHSGGIVPTVVGAEEVLGSTWRIWQNNLGVLLGVTAVTFGVGIFFGICNFVITLSFDNDPVFANIVIQCLGIINNLIGIFLGIGVIKVNFQAARGQEARFETLFSGGSRFLTVLIAAILTGIIFFLGFILCIIPGIIAVLLLWAFQHVIIDEKGGIIESLSVSASFCKINILTTIVLAFASFGIAILGFLALLIGIWPATSFISLMWAVAYLKMSGQQCVE